MLKEDKWLILAYFFEKKEPLSAGTGGGGRFILQLDQSQDIVTGNAHVSS